MSAALRSIASTRGVHSPGAAAQARTPSSAPGQEGIGASVAKEREGRNRLHAPGPVGQSLASCLGPSAVSTPRRFQVSA